MSTNKILALSLLLTFVVVSILCAIAYVISIFPLGPVIILTTAGIMISVETFKQIFTKLKTKLNN